MKKVFIGGIQGVGKSTICKNIEEKYQKIGSFSFGETMQNIAKEDILGYKKIHLLSEEERNYIVLKSKEKLEKILEKSYYDFLLFDNHFTVFRNDKIFNTFNGKEILFYDKLILITAPIIDIVNRILLDSEKERVDLSNKGDFIFKHQKLEEERAKELSYTYSIPFLKLNNINLGCTIEEVMRFIYKQ